jgi:hypothetical protein
MPPKVDSQVTELLGRNQLISELLRAGLEVALPLRDRGIDLIAYSDLDPDAPGFVACPIQMKAATASSFTVLRRYERFRNLILAFIWHITEPENLVTYALTYLEASVIVERMGWTHSRSWTDLGGYGTTKAEQNTKLMTLLKEHQMTPERWRQKIMGMTSVAPAAETIQ